MVRRRIEEVGHLTVETVWDDIITSVTITDGSVTAKGNARWFTADHYSEEVGRAIAFTRALARFAHKTEKYLLKGLAEV